MAFALGSVHTYILCVYLKTIDYLKSKFNLIEVKKENLHNSNTNATFNKSLELVIFFAFLTFLILTIYYHKQC